MRFGRARSDAGFQSAAQHEMMIVVAIIAIIAAIAIPQLLSPFTPEQECVSHLLEITGGAPATGDDAAVCPASDAAYVQTAEAVRCGDPESHLGKAAAMVQRDGRWVFVTPRETVATPPVELGTVGETALRWQALPSAAGEPSPGFVVESYAHGFWRLFVAPVGFAICLIAIIGGVVNLIINAKDDFGEGCGCLVGLGLFGSLIGAVCWNSMAVHRYEFRDGGVTLTKSIYGNSLGEGVRVDGVQAVVRNKQSIVTCLRTEHAGTDDAEVVETSLFACGDDAGFAAIEAALIPPAPAKPAPAPGESGK